MAKYKEETLEAKAAGSSLRKRAQRYLPGWKIEIKYEPEHDNLWATTDAFPLNREAVFTIMTPVKIDSLDAAAGNPRARMSWKLICLHEIAHALVSLPMQGMKQDIERIKRQLPPALAEDFAARFHDYEEGLVNCIAVGLVAVDDELD